MVCSGRRRRDPGWMRVADHGHGHRDERKDAGRAGDDGDQPEAGPQRAAVTTGTSTVPATTDTQDRDAINGTATEPGAGPEASYCEDGHCLTIHCPPASASEDYICSASSNPTARAAVASAEPPTCDVVATVLAANRDIIGGQDNCETSSGSYFSVLWYPDMGPTSCARVAPRPTRLVMDDAYLAEPVCAAVASGTGPPWPEVAQALSTQTGAAPNATTEQP